MLDVNFWQSHRNVSEARVFIEKASWRDWDEEPRRGLYHETWRSAGVAAALGDTSDPTNKILPFFCFPKPNKFCFLGFPDRGRCPKTAKKSLCGSALLLFCSLTKPHKLFGAPFKGRPVEPDALLWILGWFTGCGPRLRPSPRFPKFFLWSEGTLARQRGTTHAFIEKASSGILRFFLSTRAQRLRVESNSLLACTSPTLSLPGIYATFQVALSQVLEARRKYDIVFKRCSPCV